MKQYVQLTFLPAGTKKKRIIWAQKLRPGRYLVLDKEGQPREMRVKGGLAHEIVLTATKEWSQFSEIEVGETIDPRAWPIGVIELKARMNLKYGELELVPNEKCGGCGGDATRCYPRHARGRSCG